jgi:hypothetical protein
VEFISIRLGARGLGGKKTELTANRFHGALCEYGRPLRHALDDKLAKTRHFVKKFFVLLQPVDGLSKQVGSQIVESLNDRRDV